MVERGHFKDEGLDKLASNGQNVAQFTSYDDHGNQRFSRNVGQAPNHKFASQAEAAKYMLTNTPEHRVNVRSWNPYRPEGSPFTPGLSSVDDILAVLRVRQGEELHSIMHETIDIHDGGVSGVVFGNTVEITPDDTPRGVEDPGVARFTRKMGADVIKTIYGVIPDFVDNLNTRQEFTITPLRRGVMNGHTITWELRDMGGAPTEADTQWPNRLSTMLGDKAFGLVMADQIGLNVPRTTVINRRVAPFSLGQPTGCGEFWMRTAPNTLTPGKYTTTHGWVDPYKIMQVEDPSGENIASILSQEGVDAEFSGVCAMGADGKLIINGKHGYGDDFMVGESGADTLPRDVIQKVQDNYYFASEQLGGPVRFEWVFDGDRVWTVQLHRGKSESYGNTVYPGDESTAYMQFITHDADGHSRIEELRELIANHQPGIGIELIGDVGVTSHLGDMLRKARVPSRIINEK